MNSGSLLCRIGLHKWGRWEHAENYIDTSYGLWVKRARFIRRCERCGLPETLSQYGHI